MPGLAYTLLLYDVDPAEVLRNKHTVYKIEDKSNITELDNIILKISAFLYKNINPKIWNATQPWMISPHKIYVPGS